VLGESGLVRALAERREDDLFILVCRAFGVRRADESDAVQTSSFLRWLSSRVE
jgi:hypothetical protein